jgi:hypothetical protein
MAVRPSAKRMVRDHKRGSQQKKEKEKHTSRVSRCMKHSDAVYVAERHSDAAHVAERHSEMACAAARGTATWRMR